MKRYENPEFVLRQLFTENVCELSAVYEEGDLPPEVIPENDEV